ncbi:Leucine rich repeat containing protein 13-like protein [Leptotrombidium deliense]|uniref:Leucine rich repeat containing protein 13-like protein n=1 Tax=Leptotrombidium deliense TaxID=299467 RepID=A0A443SP67_9ACAR|nr:Leucine rich repeat containing protein 13-like protein [Leptotrombidium deliense]
MKVFIALFVVLLTLTISGAQESAEQFCPSSTLFPDYCSCDEFDRSINCYLNKRKDGQVFDVKQSLKKVGDFVKSSGLPQQYFDELLILCVSDAKPSVIFDENSLGYLQFRKVTFDKCIVNKIHPNAFNSNHRSLEIFNLRNNVLEKEAIHNIFKAVIKLNALRVLDISFNNIEKIPANAFKAQRRQENLTEIDLQSNAITEIGDFAFADVSSLEFLYLDNNKILSIKGNTFAFQEKSSARLLLSLNSNKLNTSSFEQSAFLSLQRPATLDMNGNEITILTENIFKPFLFMAKRNVINIKGNPIECNEKNAWLVPYRTLFRYLLKLDVPHTVWSCLSPQSKQAAPKHGH